MILFLNKKYYVFTTNTRISALSLTEAVPHEILKAKLLGEIAFYSHEKPSKYTCTCSWFLNGKTLTRVLGRCYMVKL